MKLFSIKNYETLQIQFAIEINSIEGFAKWRNIFNELKDVNQIMTIYELKYKREINEFNDICEVFEKDFMFSNKSFSDFYKSNRISYDEDLHIAVFHFFLNSFVAFVKKINYIYNGISEEDDQTQVFEGLEGCDVLHLVLGVNEHIEKSLCENNIDTKRFGKTYNCFINSKKIIMHEFFMKEIKT
jgi:hypothetical protein